MLLSKLKILAFHLNFKERIAAEFYQQEIYILEIRRQIWKNCNESDQKSFLSEILIFTYFDLTDFTLEIIFWDM